MIAMSVACEHGGEIVQRAFTAIGRVHCGSVCGMTSDDIAGLEHGSCQRAGRGRLATDEISSDSEHAADPISKFAREIGQDLVKLAALEPEIGARVIVGE